MKRLIYFFFINLISIFSVAQSPIFEWFQPVGYRSINDGRSIITDDYGNVYSTGCFIDSADFDPGPTVFNLYSNGTRDIFVQKLDANGNLLWAINVGGASSDFPNKIALDEFQNVYVTGQFKYDSDFDPGDGEFILSSQGDYDIFVLKLDSDGGFQWAKTMGGTQRDVGHSLSIDDDNNVFVTGEFEGNVDFNPEAGEDFHLSNGLRDIFIQKLDSDGGFMWCKTIGSDHENIGESLITDEDGNVYVSGWYVGTTDFDPGDGIFELVPISSGDLFFLKLNNSGEFIWAKTLGGADYESNSELGIDHEGNILFSGYHKGTVDFDFGDDTHEYTTGVGGSLFVLKVDQASEFIWCQHINVNDDPGPVPLTLDDLDNILLTGELNGSVDFDPGLGSFVLSSLGGQDVFILKLASNGEFEWAKLIGGTGPNIGKSIATHGTENVYVTGSSKGVIDFDPGEDEVLYDAGGATTAAFVLKLGAYDLGLEKPGSSRNLLVVYPNPSNGLVNIDLTGLENASIEVFDFSGKLVYQQQNLIDSRFQFNLPSAIGVYLIRIESSDKVYLAKMVKN